MSSARYCPSSTLQADLCALHRPTRPSDRPPPSAPAAAVPAGRGKKAKAKGPIRSEPETADALDASMDAYHASAPPRQGSEEPHQSARAEEDRAPPSAPAETAAAEVSAPPRAVARQRSLSPPLAPSPLQKQRMREEAARSARGRAGGRDEPRGGRGAGGRPERVWGAPAPVTRTRSRSPPPHLRARSPPRGGRANSPPPRFSTTDGPPPPGSEPARRRSRSPGGPRGDDPRDRWAPSGPVSTFLRACWMDRKLTLFFDLLQAGPGRNWREEVFSAPGERGRYREPRVAVPDEVLGAYQKRARSVSPGLPKKEAAPVGNGERREDARARSPPPHQARDEAPRERREDRQDPERGPAGLAVRGAAAPAAPVQVDKSQPIEIKGAGGRSNDRQEVSSTAPRPWGRDVSCILSHLPFRRGPS